MVVTCTACGHVRCLDQPHAFHAGFSNEGFLYNDDGTLVLIWSTFDPEYQRVVGAKHPWILNDDERHAFERVLPPAPHGGHWRFSNPARCDACHGPISKPLGESIYYLVLPGSIDTRKFSGGLSHYIRSSQVPTSEPAA